MVRFWLFTALAALGVGAGLGVGCGGVDNLVIRQTAGSGGSAATGVPCDVADALKVCVECHGDPPIGDAVGSLLTYADLTAPAPSDPSKTMAQLAVTRMQDATSPMPPKGIPAATADQIKALSDWVASGSPTGDCNADAGPPDTTFEGGPVCNSGKLYTGGDGRQMDPGMACINCHKTTLDGDPPIFTFAGTVFASGHAKDRCLPTADEKTALSQAQVVITGADNSTITLPLKVGVGFYNGNFSTTKTVPLPYTAKVVYMGKERTMVTPQTDGDCNGCHTAAGKNDAPGRIALPQ